MYTNMLVTNLRSEVVECSILRKDGVNLPPCRILIINQQPFVLRLEMVETGFTAFYKLLEDSVSFCFLKLMNIIQWIVDVLLQFFSKIFWIWDARPNWCVSKIKNSKSQTAREEKWVENIKHDEQFDKPFSLWCWWFFRLCSWEVLNAIVEGTDVLVFCFGSVGIDIGPRFFVDDIITDEDDEQRYEGNEDN